MDTLTRMRKAAERVENLKRLMASVGSDEIENSFNILSKKMKNVSDYTHLGYDSRHPCMHVERDLIERVASHFQKFISLDVSSFIECVRNYVATSHAYGTGLDIGNDYGSPFADVSSILRSICRYKEGVRKEPLHMQCGCCVAAMVAILHFFGMKTRVLNFSSATAEQGLRVGGHVLLEVFNRETCLWEVHDPTYDCGYGCFHDGTLKKCSSADFLCADWKTLAPTYSTTHFDWETVHHEEDDENQDLRRKEMSRLIEDGLFRKYSDIIIINYSSFGAICVLNLDNIDLKKRYPDNGNKTLLEFLNTGYVFPVIMARYRGKLISLPPTGNDFCPERIPDSM